MTTNADFPEAPPAPAPVPLDDQAIRAAMVARALAVVGLGAAAPTRSEYLDLLATCPADRASPKRCAELVEMSSCALVVRGLWLRAGVRHPILLAPYRDRMAVSDVMAIAREADALKGAHGTIEPGDAVIIEGPEHVLTATARIERETTTLRSVDGGQRDAERLEVIAARERTHRGGAKPSLDWRPILEVVDVVTLVRRWTGAA